MALVLLLVLSGCRAEPADLARDDGARDGGAARAATSARGVPGGAAGRPGEDLLPAHHELVLRRADREVDLSLRFLRPRAESAARTIVDQYAGGSTATGPALTDDLRAVTRDVVVGVACHRLRRGLPVVGRAVDPGLEVPPGRVGEEAVVAMVVRGWPLDVARPLVHDRAYAVAVVARGRELAAQAHPLVSRETFEIALRPSVDRAVVVHLRACYDPPRSATSLLR
jgi:hypothetical protein